jgi:hypothetical protein
MSRHEKAEMKTQMRRELDAIDATLRGEATAGSEATPAGEAPLADVSRALQTLRPRPTEEFVRALDARAAAGFRREGRAAASATRRSARRPAMHARMRALPAPRRRALLVSALGVAVTVALVAVVAVSPWRSGGGTMPTRPERAPSALSTAGPSVIAPSPASKTSATRAGRAGGETLLASPAGAVPGAPARRIERTSTLDLGVAPGSIESSAQTVFTIVGSFNGYVRQSNVSSGGGQSGASFDVRLPTANLTAAIAALSHLGHVRSENDTTNDVSDQFDALQRSLGDLRAERASLLRQLAGTADAQRAATLKARLHVVEVGIAQRQGTLRSLRARIEYTRLSLSLTPEAKGAASHGDLTPGAAARDAARVLDAALAVLVIGAAAVLPLALVGIAGWIAVALTRRRLRERTLDAG